LQFADALEAAHLSAQELFDKSLVVGDNTELELVLAQSVQDDHHLNEHVDFRNRDPDNIF
jgi:hypothetical protein